MQRKSSHHWVPMPEWEDQANVVVTFSINLGAPPPAISRRKAISPLLKDPAPIIWCTARSSTSYCRRSAIMGHI